MKKSREEYNTYMRTYMRKRYHRRRVEAIEKLGGACTVCGSKDALEIDHIDRQKKGFDLSKGFAGWSEKRMQQELAKCQILCDVCHQAKSIEEAGKKKAEHGTNAMYAHHRCRCGPCKQAHAEVMKKYMNQKHNGRAAGS